MLAENETLFVEHKSGAGHEGYQVAKAICSFANSLGGWVLIGVTDGRPSAGEEGGWEPAAATDLTDRVREILKAQGVDPIPGFAATVRDAAGDPPKPVGIVRVYESSDAPHVMGNGQVFVRSVAEDSNRQRIYTPGGVETQVVLADLVRRGERGITLARERLEKGHCQALLGALGYRWAAGGEWQRPIGSVAIRGAPVTTSRLGDWAVSESAYIALKSATQRLCGRHDVEPVLEAGVSHLATSVSAEADYAGTIRHRNSTTSVDCAGVVGAAVSFGYSTPPIDPETLTLSEFIDVLVRPVLTAVIEILELGELHGRTLLQLDIERLDQVATLDETGVLKPAPSLPIGGEISTPSADEDVEVESLLARWRGDIGRAAGYANQLR